MTTDSSSTDSNNGPSSNVSPDSNATPAADDAAKPTDQWVTGDEPATGPQRSYLQTLAREAGEEVPDDLTKAQASDLIDNLQGKSDRVADS